ncbi:MFS general substrate transporter [Mytilinidion resinicola]|uniref:MFS general substrate transporter n=1 Tax=Mytilinidion resinicola TaxID=574789 RepID=A0A6A6YL76_9PEZI|nr:MFS general substrate transporter [Mytilinidion resinicola]KAF2809560.1 MFS general substrate transporter [Mytilinidion resinicola]
MANKTSGDRDFASRGPVVLGVTTATLVCATVFVVLRLISRFGIVQRVGWDDHFIILAWLLAFGTSFSICYGTSVGLGRHEVDVPADWDSALKKSEYIFSVLYNPALMATKTSILIFYLTLSKTQKIFRRATIATLAVVNIGGLALTLLNVVQCRPVGAAFDETIPETATCTDIITIYLSSAPLNIITDLAILFLPMPILTSMRLPKKQKIILVVTFGFGIFVAVVDVVRIAYLQSAARTHLRSVEDKSKPSGNASRNSDTNDFSYYASYSLMFSAIEVNVGIMCACVPAMKPLVSRFMPHLLRDTSQTEKTVLTTGSGLNHPDLANGNLQPPSQDLPTRPTLVAAPGAANPEAALGTALGGNADGAMGMMDFLTTPDMIELPCERANTYATAATAGSAPPFFDFVNFNKKKSIVDMTTKECIYPVMMVTVLFFVWGFAYGLLDTLNAQFQTVAHMSSAQFIGLHSAYYGGYFLGPLTFGRLVFQYWGFKACYTVGLVIYACGTLVFWPSAVLTSFPAFFISNFIVGLGLSTLEISANPFITLCGPPEWAEVRLNLSQGFQAIGTVVSPILAKKVLFKASADSLIDVQWTYLGLSLFNFALAIVYFYIPLPEATDDELEAAAQRINTPNTEKLFNVKVIWITLGLGVFSQLCYVGGQESISTTFAAYVARIYPGLSSVNHQAIGHTAFALSRFLTAGASLWIKPRYQLLFFYVGAIVFAAASMNGHGTTPAALVIMLFFFEGPIFSLIFAQSIHGLGKNAKLASVLLTSAIGGGAVFPPIAYGAMKAKNVQYAYCVVMAAFAAGTLFPIWLNLSPLAKAIVDPKKYEDH